VTWHPPPRGGDPNVASYDRGMLSITEATSPRSRRLILTPRDRRIVLLAGAKVSVESAAVHDARQRSEDYLNAVRALREAVEESIPGGRIFHLGEGPRGPILGSLISGVGIMLDEEGVRVVRRRKDGQVDVLDLLSPLPRSRVSRESARRP
jgi:hypothetical protein